MSTLTLRPFFETIYALRSREEMILFSRPADPLPEDLQDVTDFLEGEWENERLEYPGVPPPFDPGAALWAARTIYTAAQLLLFRGHRPADIPALLPPYPGAITSGAILSADLCLRMLPQLLRHYKVVDPEDAAIPLLEGILQSWPYSSIGYSLEQHSPEMRPILSNPCALQLYADRVIAYKDKSGAALPGIAPVIGGSLGDHAAYFRKEQKTI